MIMQEYNIKGVRSISYPAIFKWQFIEYTFKELIKNYNYVEIKLQLIEKTRLFERTLGKNSEIIQKEMFSFKDKNNQNITLLPEGTTSCTKDLISTGAIRNNQKNNVWYISPMFRRENPQKGRNRLFYQIGLESFGYETFCKEVEHILLFKKLFDKLNIKDIILEVNCIDNSKITIFNSILFCFLKNHIINFKKLKNITTSNLLFLLDKLKKLSKIKVPCQLNYLQKMSKRNFIYFLYILKKTGIYFIYNNFLVRGLDYYSNIVYEWVTLIDNKKLAICSGGRYDNLSKKISKYTSYSTGCALGIDRLVLKINLDTKIVKKEKLLISDEQPLHINIRYLDYINILNNYKFEYSDIGTFIKNKPQYFKKKTGIFFINKKFIKSKLFEV